MQDSQRLSGFSANEVIAHEGLELLLRDSVNGDAVAENFREFAAVGVGQVPSEQ